MQDMTVEKNVFFIDDQAEFAARAADAIYTISDLSAEFGVTLRALRFYEGKGLLRPRRQGVMRIYSQSDRSRLEAILRGKRLGFTLAEITTMIARTEEAASKPAALKLTPEACLEQINTLERRRMEIEAAIDELRDVHRRLLETAKL